MKSPKTRVLSIDCAQSWNLTPKILQPIPSTVKIQQTESLAKHPKHDLVFALVKKRVHTSQESRVFQKLKLRKIMHPGECQENQQQQQTNAKHKAQTCLNRKNQMQPVFAFGAPPLSSKEMSLATVTSGTGQSK